MQDFNQKRQIMIRHFPPNTILHQIHTQHARKIAIADVFALRVRRPDPQRGHLAKEAELAVEEELGESGSGDRGAVVVCEAEGVGVAVFWSGCEVFFGRGVLTVIYCKSISRRFFFFFVQCLLMAPWVG